jgi:hypothetical protein
MNVFRTAAFGLLAAALVGGPSLAFAQATNVSKVNREKMEKPAAGVAAERAAKKKGSPPLHGKVAAINKVAKTITVGQTTVQITSETKITKANKPATLDEGAVGEEVMILYTKADDGRKTARAVRFGPKPGGKGDAKKQGEGKKGKSQTSTGL